jgi:hypothetical protein
MTKGETTLKGFANCGTLSGFNEIFCCIPRVLASSNPGLKLANAFGVMQRYLLVITA